MVKPINEITQQVQASLQSQRTQAGQKDNQAAFDQGEQIDAINKMVALFKVNYGNQFNAAYPDLESVNTLKKLWFNALKEYPPEHILKSAEAVMKKSRYLPNVAQLAEQCDKALETYGLPDAHSAYVEACMAPSPKAEFNWRHPAVYYAGLATGWHFLQSEIESVAFPVFERNYQILCRKVMKGESIDIDMPKAIPEKIVKPLDKQEQLEKLATFKKEVGLTD